MGTIGPAKILMVLIVALIVLGPDKLPKMARQVGRFWGDFTRFRQNLEREVREALTGGPDDEESPFSHVTDALNDVTGTMRDALSERSLPDSATGATGAPAPGAAGDSSSVGPEAASPPEVSGVTPPRARVPNGELASPPTDPSMN